MATFKTWNRATRSLGPAIEIKAAEVAEFKDRGVRDEKGNMVACTEVIFVVGGKDLVAVPSGEFNDRLNDDAQVPLDEGTRSMFEGL